MNPIKHAEFKRLKTQVSDLLKYLNRFEKEFFGEDVNHDKMLKNERLKLSIERCICDECKTSLSQIKYGQHKMICKTCGKKYKLITRKTRG